MPDGLSIMLYNRIDERKPFQKECILANQFGLIKTLSIDFSKIGLGVGTNKTVPFKNGCVLAIFIPSMDKLFQAKLIWTKKDVENNATRLGLKLSSGLHL